MAEALAAEQKRVESEDLQRQLDEGRLQVIDEASMSDDGELCFVNIKACICIIYYNCSIPIIFTDEDAVSDDRIVRDQHIAALSKLIGSDWERLARAFALSQAQIDAHKKNAVVSVCVICVLYGFVIILYVILD
jgi:hypothetical protein